MRARAEGGWAILEVADTGLGIPAAEQGRLFERFYRTEAARRAAVPGTGLGLAISKMIAEAHGGRIGVESEEGRGTTFRVELPLAGAALDAPGVPVDGSATTPR
jgi:signal transduction histidine kinase